MLTPGNFSLYFSYHTTLNSSWERKPSTQKLKACYLLIRGKVELPQWLHHSQGGDASPQFSITAQPHYCDCCCCFGGALQAALPSPPHGHKAVSRGGGAAPLSVVVCPLSGHSKMGSAPSALSWDSEGSVLAQENNQLVAWCRDTPGSWDLLAFPSRTALREGRVLPLLRYSLLRGAGEGFHHFYGGRNMTVLTFPLSRGTAGVWRGERSQGQTSLLRHSFHHPRQGALPRSSQGWQLPGLHWPSLQRLEVGGLLGQRWTPDCPSG